MRLPPTDDTIAAVATAPGQGAIGIVRLSGPACYRIADTVFVSSGGSASTLGPGRATYGRIADGGEVIDEALLLGFRAPHSYTGDDAVEFQTHGGSAVLRRVLDLCLEQGARLAGPGEFTLRAYLNGRLDLVQAESVLGIVNARTERARRMAAAGLTRELSMALDNIQTDLTAVLAGLQAVLDYPEEGVPESDRSEPLERALRRIDALLATARAGRLAQEGAKIALVGRPNVGKSSLLNALLGYDRSLVSDTPGTTRDYLEAPLTLAGLPLVLIDTAGLRSSDDVVEAAGVARSQQLAGSADLTLLMFDRSQPLTESDLEQQSSAAPERTLAIANKSDLDAAWPLGALSMPALAVSATRHLGLDDLRDAIHDRLLGSAGGSELWIGNERHIEALRTARALVEAARNAPDDLAGLDLEEALGAVAQLTGRGDVAEETLAAIFENFCVGK